MFDLNSFIYGMLVALLYCTGMLLFANWYNSKRK